jgi:hypothetical protein
MKIGRSANGQGGVEVGGLMRNNVVKGGITGITVQWKWA